MRNLTRREYLLLALFGVIAGWFIWHKLDKKKDQQTASTVLAPNVVEKIVVNPDTHKLTVVTKDKTQELFLPDRPSSIEVGKNGQVTVSSPQFGTELHFFCGIYGSDAFRIGAGLDGLYYKKWDLGLGVADKVGNYTPVAFVQVSYTFYDNLSVGLTLDNKQHVGAGLMLRI